eukprot:TRINITY_DN1294_c0_g2_i6.p1 TRINITY_DN1294_c0_g2~~TRINITY_DN1294_c0_g2_i6.p1  ORF type:complete len:333 (+),score=64.84 TRINITY_DN1294_c0_g2_i6:138-1136(+)
MSSRMAMWMAFGSAGIGLMAWRRRRKTSEDSGPTQAPPGYLLIEGVHCLYPPKDATQNYEFEFDVVFIHGLQVTDTAGFWWKTWTVIGDDGECWPATWIKDIFPKARVLALEYNSIARGKKPSTMWNQANDAVNTLIANPVNLGTRPFFLVGHSMGGLLAKELLLKASRPPHDGALLKLCKGVVFYGVPHLGSDLANWGKFLNDLFCGGLRASDFIKEDLLSLGKATVQRNTEFNGLPRMKTYDFIENWDTEIAPGVQLKVVSEASAATFADSTTRCIIEADHYNVCRPARKESKVFTNFVNFVKEALDAEAKLKQTTNKGKGELGLRSPPR